MRVMRILKTTALSGAAVAAVFTGVMGFAHTHAGRPLLVAMRPVMSLLAGGKGACPFGYDKKATPEQKEAARAAFSESHRGDAAAGARPALGFTLDGTTPADVLTWAKARGVECNADGTSVGSAHGVVKRFAGSVTHSDLECRDVPASLLPEGERAADVSSLWLTFGAQGTLTAVVAIRKGPRAEVISDAFAAAKDNVALEAGPATTLEGSGSPRELASGLLVQSTAEYRFSNYYALTRATNVGSAYVLTEEYRSLAD
jgi:hypothetical protein